MRSILRTLMPHLASNVGSGMQPQRFASCPSIHHCNNQSKVFPYIYLSLRSAQHRNQQISIVTACTSSVFTQVNTKTLQQKCTFITQPQRQGNRGVGWGNWFGVILLRFWIWFIPTSWLFEEGRCRIIVISDWRLQIFPLSFENTFVANS